MPRHLLHLPPRYLLLVSVDVDQVEGEEVVLGAHQQPSSLLVQQEGVVARAVRQAVKGDQVTGLQHLCRGRAKKKGHETPAVTRSEQHNWNHLVKS